MIMSKVDHETRSKWEESLEFRSLPTWKECNEFLDRRCQRLEVAKITNTKHEHSLAATAKSSKSATKTFNAHTCSKGNVKEKNCELCLDLGHTISSCAKFIEVIPQDRYAKIKELNLCTNCLNKGHFSSNCTSKYTCKVCKKKHHTLLHVGDNAISSTAPYTSNVCAALTHSASGHSQVFLATALVQLRKTNGDYVLARALLDNCSQINFIREDLARSLQLPLKNRCAYVDGVNDAHTAVQYCTEAAIKSRMNEYKTVLEFFVTPIVSRYSIETQLGAIINKIPGNIELADPLFDRPRRIDLLIGGDIFFELLSIGQVKLGDGLPTLQKTVLGWVVAGKVSNETHCKSSFLHTMNTTILEAIDEKITRFWQLEEIEKGAAGWTEEQQQCERFFNQSVLINATGRIVVKIPFKEQRTLLGASYNIALRRLYSLERKLQKNDTLRLQYIEFMREYESLGHMTQVPMLSAKGEHYYIPHHCVIKPSSTTTKLRVVFDASCKTDSGVSLNDVMMVGPTIQNDLFTTLLRFRLHQYCLTGDITKMYRQVLVDPNDRVFQLILWREGVNSSVKTYALNTVTYGTAAAPFLAIRSLQLTAEGSADLHPIGAQVILSDFYVDDLLTGADSITSLTTIQHEVTEILARYGFNITKWRSNYNNIKSFSQHQDLKELKIDEGSSNALGVSWNPQADNLTFSYSPKVKNHMCSKRSILSQSSSLFDPLGLVSPIIIRAKILLQELWLQRIDWDESVPQSIYTAWQKLNADLQQLSRIQIPRYIFMPGGFTVEIHGFCDASTRAYGCVLYARCINKKNEISVQIITSKSRVAPLKVKTLPRLELCGAHLLALLWKKVEPTLKLNGSGTYFWSDSQVVLHWLKMHSSKLSTFVGNRVSEIQDVTPNVIWRHVPSSKNPADLISRGCSVEEMMTCNWMTGPRFLHQPCGRWPVSANCIPLSEANDEIKKTSLICQIQSNPLMQVINNCSHYLKLLRIFVNIQRFIKFKCKHELIPSFISPQEMSASLQCVVALVQNHHFATIFCSLQQGKSVTGALSMLSLFIDDSETYNVLRVGGRLRHADISEDAKHPMLLPKDEAFVTCLMRYIHIKNYHAGPKALVSMVRERFWVLNARKEAARIVRNCIHCAKYNPKLTQQIMGDLPKHRVRQARPFQHCGVDFCGPILTYLNLRGKQPYKSYIAVFVCFATKAVHLEAVSNLSSNSFIEALKRLIGRRGLPQIIYCDNGTNFVGASQRLKELRDQFLHQTTITDVIGYCTNKEIEFKFIPPRAPHFGGLWEAAVKVAKGHLLRAIGHTRLTYKELSTVLVEIEAVMNSRPLTPQSADPNDLSVLTPGHFLIGSSLSAIPEPISTSININHLQRWQRINAVKAAFWRRWSTEYLHELQNKSKWQVSHKDLAIGDLVLIHEDNIAPLKWPLGRIQGVTLGKDGHVRVAAILTARGVIKRPVVKLARLPIC